MHEAIWYIRTFNSDYRGRNWAATTLEEAFDSGQSQDLNLGCWLQNLYTKLYWLYLKLEFHSNTISQLEYLIKISWIFSVYEHVQLPDQFWSQLVLFNKHMLNFLDHIQAGRQGDCSKIFTMITRCTLVSYWEPDAGATCLRLI